MSILVKCIACGKPFLFKVQKGWEIASTHCSVKCFLDTIYLVTRGDNKLLNIKPTSSRLNDFKSDYERDMATWLTKHGVCWFYELVTISNGKDTYIPDFMISPCVGFIEVKGLWHPGAYAKLKRLKPLIEKNIGPLFVVDSSLIKEIRKDLNA